MSGVSLALLGLIASAGNPWQTDPNRVEIAVKVFPDMKGQGGESIETMGEKPCDYFGYDWDCKNTPVAALGCADKCGAVVETGPNYPEFLKGKTWDEYRNSMLDHSCDDFPDDKNPNDCAGKWMADCGVPQKTGWVPDEEQKCAVVLPCAKRCLTMWQSACSLFKPVYDECVEKYGGSEDQTDAACTKPSPPTMSEYHGAGGGLKFTRPERDGTATQSGDKITVITKRPIPEWCENKALAEQLNPTGTMPWQTYYNKIGQVKFACVGYDLAQHNSIRYNFEMCDTWEKNPNDPYAFDKFAQAAGYFPDFMGLPSKDLSHLDLISFIGHAGVETNGGGSSNSNANGGAFCFHTEQNATTYLKKDYGTVAEPKGCDAANWGKPSGHIADNGSSTSGMPSPYDNKPFWNSSYVGRGAFQLSWCYNYKWFTNWVETQLDLPQVPQRDFFSNPGYVASGDWAFASGIWFYMSPPADYSKPSMHSVTAQWGGAGSVGFTDQHGRLADNGYQTNIINGAIECGTKNLWKVKARQDSMKDAMNKMNYQGRNNHTVEEYEFLGRSGCMVADDTKGAGDLGKYPFEFWVYNDDGTHYAGDIPGSSCPNDESNPLQWVRDPTKVDGAVSPTNTPSPSTEEPPTPTNKPSPDPVDPDAGKICCVTMAAAQRAHNCHHDTPKNQCTDDQDCMWANKYDCMPLVIK